MPCGKECGGPPQLFANHHRFRRLSAGSCGFQGRTCDTGHVAPSQSKNAHEQFMCFTRPDFITKRGRPNLQSVFMNSGSYFNHTKCGIQSIQRKLGEYLIDSSVIAVDCTVNDRDKFNQIQNEFNQIQRLFPASTVNMPRRCED